MKASIVVVRHGDYDGQGRTEDSLSENGRKQMHRLREVISGHLNDIYGRNKHGEIDVTRLSISFSTTRRALESIAILKYREDLIVTELYLTERHEITEPERIVQKIFSLLAYYGATVATIVAHGDMPAVFAETLIKIASGEAKQLPSPAKGNGFLVNMATGAVIMLSPEKPKDEAKQPAAIHLPASQVPIQQQAIPPRTQTIPTSLFDDMDNDIPF